jgi:hypothetical protein
MDYFPPGNVAGLYFFRDKTNAGYVVGAWPMGTMGNLGQYEDIYLEQLEWEDDRLIFESDVKQDWTSFIAISRQSRARYEWLLGDNQFIRDVEQLLDNAVNCGLIYNNPDIKLYVSDDANKPINH